MKLNKLSSRVTVILACALLAAMDGVVLNDHVVRIFTTNEDVGDIDPAFTRPGRIDVRIPFPKPTEGLRLRLIQAWPQEIQDHIDVARLVEHSHDWSFADLEAIRTFLVTHKIVDGAEWDLDWALEQFDARDMDTNAPTTGFGGG